MHRGSQKPHIGRREHLVLHRRDLLKIQKHIDGALGFIGLQPVADFIVVNRQVPENFRRVRLQLGQEFFVLGFVKEFALRNGPRFAQMFFGIER